MSKSFHISNRVAVQAAYVVSSNFDLHSDTFLLRNAVLDAAFHSLYASNIVQCYGYIGLNMQNEPKDIAISLNTQGETVRKEAYQFRSDVRFALRDDQSKLGTICDRLKLHKMCELKARGSMFNALTFFQKGIADYESDFLSHGIPAAQINHIKATVDTYIETYKNQDTVIGKIVNVTDEQQELINKVYATTASICEYGQMIFKDEPAKAKLFTLSVIAKRYMIQRKRKNADETGAPVERPADDPMLNLDNEQKDDLNTND